MQHNQINQYPRKSLISFLEEFTLLVYTGLVVELEHLKIETRLKDEKFANAMGEYVTER